jgi:SAM-dependent methyltransferase
MAHLRLADEFRSLSDAEWYKRLAASIERPEIDGQPFPRFPPAALQEQFVGQSGEQTLREAYAFYTFAKSQMQSLGNPLARASRFLDFGCGWGRFLRFFWKDVDEGNLHGCDTHQAILDLCESLDVPGQLAAIQPLGRLPYPDAFFDGVLSYSVFTHLPELVHLHWMREFARVCKPLAVVCMTLEPRRFLDRVAAIPADSTSPWELALRRAQPAIPAHVAEFAARGFTFLPSNVGCEDVYGDAVCSPGFVARHWAPAFDLMTYIDHASQMSQAAVVLQRRR